jgi:RecA-family ATPase
MSMQETFEPDPLEIDPRPCGDCGRTIDQHRRVDTPEGPEFFCEEIERQIHLDARAIRLRMELADPRDRDRARAELGLVNGSRPDEPPPPDGPEAYGLPADTERDDQPEAGDKVAQATEPTLLTTITPAAWRGTPLPPMQWLALHRIPAGDVTILSGDGGGGKTTVALQLAVSVANSLGDWLGTTCEAGPVLFFSAEEPEDEIRRRIDRIARNRGIDPDDMENLHLHFAKPAGCTLGTGVPNHPIAPTEVFKSLKATAKQIQPALLIIDSNAATLGGNYVDRVHARTFVSLFKEIAQEIGCAVLLLNHPSAAGLTNGTGRAGNMDWQNAVRAFLYLRKIDSDDGSTGRELEIMKSNYGPTGQKTPLQWDRGHYVLEGAASAPRQAAAFSLADQTYLDCLDAMTAQGRHVCHAKGRGYAPKAFAEMPLANGMTWKAFQTAQERLFATGQIENIPYGPPSKGTKRIARKALT